MKKITLTALSLLITAGFWALTASVRAGANQRNDLGSENSTTVLTEPKENNFFDQLSLSGRADRDAFTLGMEGYNKIGSRKKELMVLIDFSKPSTEERLFVIDVPAKKVLHSSHVAHGQGSGANYATKFSNTPGSHQSSLGFYLTEGTYQGKNGYSLILNGLEQGINDKAKERAIVIHGADYCNPELAKTAGRLGRSFGCPALPRTVTKEIIDVIKDGAVVFIYAPDQNYEALSSVLNT